jgi:hypothetical protein
VGTKEPVAPAVGAPRLGHVAAARAAQLADQAQHVDGHGGLAAGQGARLATQVRGDDPQPGGGVAACPAAGGGQQAATGLITRQAVQQPGDQGHAVGQSVAGVAADAALPGRPVVADFVTPGGAAPDRDRNIAPSGHQQRGGQSFHILRGDQPRPVSGRDHRPRRQRAGMRGQEPAKRVIAGSVEPDIAVPRDGSRQ